ncbi:hypothetical protein VUR80DRAFT_7668 [Thermomyces stellatus]
MDGVERAESPKRPEGAVLPKSETDGETVTHQPAPQEPMAARTDKSRLRGGGDTGAICCGICAGLCCFECLDCCCL